MKSTIVVFLMLSSSFKAAASQSPFVGNDAIDRAAGYVSAGLYPGAKVGGLFLIDQRGCFVVGATAAHLLFDQVRRVQKSANEIRVTYLARQYRVVSVISQTSDVDVVAFENDWALVVLRKHDCNYRYKVVEPASLAGSAQFNRINLVCPNRPVKRCENLTRGRTNASDFMSDPRGSLFLHSCKADYGSSGCGFVLETKERHGFIGTQIMMRLNASQGIGRAFTDKFEAGLREAHEQIIELSSRPESW